jgi:ubiquinone/menaquinone biosynthesis C-methylase UbiE
MSGLHPTAEAGFSAAAEVYERARPGYPDDAVAWVAERLGIGPGRDVLDLAAGTGKLTRQLVPYGARIVAVEPIHAMRAELQRVVPGVVALHGTAEAIPLPDGSIDAVTCAQAFHWFEHAAALRELHRVLKPSGGVALVWNMRDEADPLQATISEITSALNRREEAHGRWREAVAASPVFGEVEDAAFTHEQHVSRAVLVDRVASVSFVAALEKRERDAALKRVRALVEDVPEPIRVPYVTDAYVFRRLD